MKFIYKQSRNVSTFEFQTTKLKGDEPISDLDHMNHTIQTIACQYKEITRIDFAKT